MNRHVHFNHMLQISLACDAQCRLDRVHLIFIYRPKFLQCTLKEWFALTIFKIETFSAR